MGWVRAGKLGTACAQVSREQGVGCGVQARHLRDASPLCLGPHTHLGPSPAQLCYEVEDAAEPTWDHPYVRQGGWRFERVREGRQLADDIRTVASRRQSAADGARPPPLDRALSGASEGLKSAWRGLVRGRTSYAYDPREGGGYRWGAGATDLAPPAPPQASLKPNSSTSSGSCSRPLRAAQALSKRDV